MQTGVEIHLHQGKPGVRAANTHCVDQAFAMADHPKPSFRTPVRTWTKLHLGTDSSSSECTPRNPQTIDDSSRRSRSARLAGTSSVRPASVGNRPPPHGARIRSRRVGGGFKARCASRTQESSPMIQRMADNSEKTALVTGASSGIGEATALQLAELGYTVYAGARRVDRMSDLADRGIRTRPVDVTDDGSMVALVETIIADTGRIDVLVNNAGYGLYGALEDVPIEEARRQFEVNVFGLARLTQLVLPQMRAQRDGYIVNISSMGGKIWEPLGSWYHASKFAVEGLSDSLRVEVAEFGIKVVIIEPGTIRSEWSGIAADKLEATSANTPYARQAKLVGAGLRAADGLPIASGPEVVAEVIAKAVQSPKPRTRYPAGGGARGMLMAERILPDRGFDRLIQLGYRLASRRA